MLPRRVLVGVRFRLPPILVRPLGAVALGFVLLAAGWYGFQPEPRQQEVDRLLANVWSGDKRVSWSEAARDIWQLYLVPDAVGRVAPGQSRGLVYGGWPRFRGQEAADAAVRVLSNQAFVVGYSDALGGPLWAAYRVRDVPRIPRPPARPDRFQVDRRTRARIAPEDYSASGFDRGHLAPNFAIATRHGVAAQRETFLMSNISPQRPSLNQGLWRELEERMAVNYPARYGEVWVFVGPVFGEEPRRIRGRIAIPDAFFKIVIDEQDGRLRTLAWIVPQEARPEDDPARYLTSIEEIERRTGLDFLPDLDDGVERSVERYRGTRVW